MFRERKFHFNLWLFGSIFTLGITAIVQLLPLTGKYQLRFGNGLLPTLALLATLWLVSILLWRLFPTYVGPDGLRATDGIGRFHEVRWDEMQKASNLLGFCWLRHGKTGKSLCFPLFLENRKEFREYVTHQAPENNPLRAYLAK